MDVDQLRAHIASREVVIVVGAGVALLATDSHPCAGWIGLLESGIQHCVQNIPGLPDDWAERTRGDLKSGDMHDLLSAAHKVSAKLGAPGGGRYARWLADTVGRLQSRDPSVLHAVATLGCPILTTNYDSLIEQATALPTFTWRQSAAVELALRDPTRRGVVHLHGHWADPESVVLGISSYEKILDAPHTQAVLRALLVNRTLLYVGFGAGLRDPNFSALRAWAREVLGGSPFTHVRLAREGDRAAVQKEHALEENIHVMAYGRDYSDLVAFLTGLCPAPPASPGSPLPHHVVRKPRNVPYDSLGSRFKGREPVLEELHTRLRRDPTRAAAIVSKQAIHGLGGVGKTRLAVEYALRHEAEYGALLFVMAETPEALRRNLAALCEPLVLNLPEREAREEDVRVTAALRWLSEHSSWLLVFDNVDTPAAAAEVERLLARLPGGHVLVTSRLVDWSGSIEALELDVLAEDDAVAFLLERTNARRQAAPTDTADVRALARELGGLALALEQAGAFVAKLRVSLGDYLRRWRERETKVREWHDATLMKYPHSVAVTWDTSVSQLEAPALALLRMLCWLAPEPLPRAVLETDAARAALADGVERLRASGERPQAAAASAGVEDALAGLSGFSLLKWESGNTAFRIHRLVEEVTRQRLPEDQRQAWLTAALGVVNAYLPGDPPAHDVRSWPRWEPVRAHVAAVVAAADASGLAHPTSRLMNDFGLLFKAKCVWGEAEPLYRRALAIDEASYGPDHPEVATDLNNLALLLQDTNRLAEAEPLMRRVVEIAEKSLGADHPNVATALNNLAAFLQATNRLAEAEPLMRRALTIDEASYGPDHPNVATDLNNLARVLQDTNRLAEAEPLMRRSVAIDEASYGPNHPEVATDLNNLALLLKDTNRLAEAEPLMRRALAIDEASYGPDHPDVAGDLNNLAQLLKATNRLAEAEPLMRRVVEIRLAFTQSTGHEHPHLRAACANYTGLLEQTGRTPDEAQAQLQGLAERFGIKLGDT